MRCALAYTSALSSQSSLPALLHLRLTASRSPKKSMSFKTEEPAAGALGLFPKGASAKPEEGEAQPSEFFKFEAGMSCALSKIPPAGPAAPRRLGMRQLLAKAAEREAKRVKKMWEMEFARQGQKHRHSKVCLCAHQPCQAKCSET